MDQKIIDKIWDKSSQVPDKDPKLYRQDSSGNIMYYHSYGLDSNYGWMITRYDSRRNISEDNLCAISRQNKKVIEKPIKKAEKKVIEKPVKKVEKSVAEKPVKKVNKTTKKKS